MTDHDERPPIGDVVDERMLRRWYWLKSELVEIARARGIPAVGGKVEVTDRIAAHLSGRQLTPVKRVERRDVLPAVLGADTMIEPGQRCTQALREWLRGRIGPSFTFDAATRAAVAAGGISLGELEMLWRQPRRESSEPAEQFELNRFSRSWHHDHPGGGHVEMLDAWRVHRSRPRD
ncbi:hypothetical protein [Microbacterium sp. P01]|uniref:hypothetical protein n=1 Tax=unclassified Microbacterium TaxID=2609290 RepID=UPI00366E3B56